LLKKKEEEGKRKNTNRTYTLYSPKSMKLKFR